MLERKEGNVMRLFNPVISGRHVLAALRVPYVDDIDIMAALSHGGSALQPYCDVYTGNFDDLVSACDSAKSPSFWERVDLPFHDTSSDEPARKKYRTLNGSVATGKFIDIAGTDGTVLPAAPIPSLSGSLSSASGRLSTEIAPGNGVLSSSGTLSQGQHFVTAPSGSRSVAANASNLPSKGALLVKQ